jgi:hypothetical protein
MNSNFSLAAANIVVLARSFNPSITSKEWLYKKNIIKDTISNFVHTPVLSFVETDVLSLVVESERAQINLKNISTENIELLAKVTSRLVTSLPETPYISAGFNYDFYLLKTANKLGDLFNPNNSKIRELFSDEYEIGQKIIFRFKDFIVTMTTAPNKADQAKIVVSFNFHSTVSGSEQIIERLKEHNATLQKAQAILDGVSK